MPPKRKRQMANNGQNKGEASKTHPTIQLTKLLAEMSSQIPPFASSQPTNPDARNTLDMAPKKRSVHTKFARQPMADKNLNKGKASESHPTIQHTTYLGHMTSQIPQCASSHHSQTTSHPTDPPAWTSDVIHPPSVQGAHSPGTSQSAKGDAGHTVDIAPKKRSAVRQKFVRQQMAEKDHNKGKACQSHPMKQCTARPAQVTSQHPPSASQPTNSMEGAHSPARTPDVAPPPSMEGVQSPCTPQPINTDAGRTLGLFSALEIQNNDGKPVLYLDGQGFLPSRLAANEIGDIFKRHFTHPWSSWKKIPSSTRESWFEELLGKFSVSPPDYKWAKKNFEMRGSVLLKNNLNKARITMHRPIWIKDDIWESLCEHWRSEGFKNKSTQAKINRASNCVVSHTCGSISASQHRANMMKETGTAPTPLELFRRMHQRKDNTWVDKRSELLNETFTRTMKQLTETALAQGNAPPSELDVWRDVARTKKGKVYGLGMESTAMVTRPCQRCSSSLSMEWVKKQEFDELTKELEEVRNERDELLARVANTERLVEHNNELICELVKSMNKQFNRVESHDADDEDSLSEQ